MNRPGVNITPVERLGRVAIGLLAVIASIAMLTSAAAALSVVLEILLLAAGLDLIVPGDRPLPALQQARARPSFITEFDMKRPSQVHGAAPGQEGMSDGGHGGWMVIACSVPMLAIATAIALTGAGIGFLLLAIACNAMMATMMGGMSHTDHRDTDASDRIPRTAGPSNARLHSGPLPPRYTGPAPSGVATSPPPPTMGPSSTSHGR